MLLALRALFHRILPFANLPSLLSWYVTSDDLPVSKHSDLHKLDPERPVLPVPDLSIPRLGHPLVAPPPQLSIVSKKNFYITFSATNILQYKLEEYHTDTTHMLHIRDIESCKLHNFLRINQVTLKVPRNGMKYG